VDPSAIASAIRLLTALQSQLASTTLHLARACSVDGRLDAALLDRHQVESFELAWSVAELTAAQASIDAPDEDGSDVDRRLGLVFCSEAVAATLARLDAIHTGHGLAVAPLRALADSADARALAAAGATAQARVAAGRAVIDAQGQIGRVRLDGALETARESFRRFGEEIVAPRAMAIHRQDLTIPEAILQPLREMGVFGLSIPERYGGSAPDDREDALTMVVVTETLSEASLGAAGSLITRPEILSRALLAGGTPAQKAHWLPRLAAGDPLCAIAMTEPDHGSDVAGLQLRATPVEGGWRLNGAKTWCTFAGKAGVLMVVARTDPDRRAGHRGLSLMLVEKPSTDAHEFEVVHPQGGRLRGRAIATIGYRGMHSYDLWFEDVFVPDSHVIGEREGLGRGFYYNMTGMMGGRLQTAARACGVMWAAFRAALAHAADRRVFGSPLRDYPLTLAKIAQMASRLAACRQLTYAVARRMAEGGGRVEASLVKLLACRCAEWVTREALQLHGGLGYAEETAVSRHFVDARVLSIFEGAEETLALKVIARGLFEQALQGDAHPPS
jgi:(2S)-methylsuccinyl-CoA dehydrogenase